MDAPDAAATMKAVSDAVTGVGTPDAAKLVSRPDRKAAWALVGAGPAISAMLMFVIVVIAAPRWPWLYLDHWPDRVAEVRIQALAGLGGVLAAILGVVVFRLASGGLKRVEAKAGPGSLTIDTGGDEPHDG